MVYIRRLLSIGVLMFFIVVGSKAQQLAHFTHYMFNEFMINPAVAGTFNFYQVRSVNRYQWIGIEDAPQTYTLSMYGPMAKKDMGFGGSLYQDKTGPTSRLGAYGSYAYNIGISDDMRLSMGLSLGFLQYKFDGTKITLGKDDDKIKGQSYSDFVPDANIGLYLHTSNWKVGFAAHQLVGNKLNLFDVDKDTDYETGLNKLKQHYYLTAGYIYIINRDFMIEPLMILKGVSAAPPQVDVTFKVNYQRMVWGGLSYRSMDAVSLLLGYNHQDKFYFGYAYDYSLSSIRRYNSGTHEVMLGFRFNNIK